MIKGDFFYIQSLLNLFYMPILFLNVILTSVIPKAWAGRYYRSAAGRSETQFAQLHIIYIYFLYVLHAEFVSQRQIFVLRAATSLNDLRDKPASVNGWHRSVLSELKGRCHTTLFFSPLRSRCCSTICSILPSPLPSSSATRSTSPLTCNPRPPPIGLHPETKEC